MITRTQKLMLFSGALLLLNCQTREQERAQRLRDAPSDVGLRMEGHTSVNNSTEGEDTLEQLRSKNGTEFERAYMQAQVDAHQKLLDMFDRDLITQVEDDKLEAYLKELRPTVEAHLTQARMSLRGVTVNDDTTRAQAVHAP